MTRKVYNLNDWTRWQAGRMLPLPKDKGRTVRLDVIAETAVAFRVGTEHEYLEWGGSKTDVPFGQLVGVLPHGGQETIEFYADGNILVEATSDGEVQFYCSENTQWWLEYADEPSFTKPYERPLVDPAFQAMQVQMLRNMQAMEARIAEGMRNLRAAEPPATPASQQRQQQVATDDGDGNDEASAAAGSEENPPAGEKPAAGAKKPAKAPAGGGGVQSSATGEGD